MGGGLIGNVMNNVSAKDSFFIFEEKNISERQNSVATTVSTFVVSLLFHVVYLDLVVLVLSNTWNKVENSSDETREKILTSVFSM